MTFRVQRIGDTYGVLFTEEQMRLAGLQEGTAVEVQPVLPAHGTHVAFSEGMQAYKKTEPQWAAAYEELAK